MSKEDELIKAQSLPRDIGKALMNKNRIGGFSSIPQQNGFGRDRHGLSAYLRTYNRLLQDGRYPLPLVFSIIGRL